jgi:hypothetical protein
VTSNQEQRRQRRIHALSTALRLRFERFAVMFKPSCSWLRALLPSQETIVPTSSSLFECLMFSTRSAARRDAIRDRRPPNEQNHTLRDHRHLPSPSRGKSQRRIPPIGRPPKRPFLGAANIYRQISTDVTCSATRCSTLDGWRGLVASIVQPLPIAQHSPRPSRGRRVL